MANEQRRKGFGTARDIGVYASVPSMFLVGPGLGFLAGRWLDAHFGWAPWGVTGGVFIGFLAAVKAVVDVLRTQESASRQHQE